MIDFKFKKHEFADEILTKKMRRKPRDSYYLTDQEKKEAWNHILNLAVFYHIKIERIAKNKSDLYKFHAQRPGLLKYLRENNRNYRGSITIFPINRKQDYLCALHEIGHLVYSLEEQDYHDFPYPLLNFIISTLRYAGTEGVVLDEFLSWRWALKQSIFPVDEFSLSLARHCLLGYFNDTVNRNYEIKATKIKSFKRKRDFFIQQFKQVPFFVLDEDTLIQFDIETDYDKWPVNLPLLPNPWSVEGAQCLIFLANGVKNIKKLNLPSLFTDFVTENKHYDVYKRNPYIFYYSKLKQKETKNCYCVSPSRPNEEFYRKFEQTWQTLNIL